MMAILGTGQHKINVGYDCLEPDYFCDKRSKKTRPTCLLWTTSIMPVPSLNALGDRIMVMRPSHRDIIKDIDIAL